MLPHLSFIFTFFLLISFLTDLHDTIRDAILTCARKPTWVSLIYRTEPTTKKCKNRKKTKSRKQICSEITVNSPGNPRSKYLSRRKEGLQWEGFTLRIDALRFQTGCRKRRLNLRLFFSLFILCCSRPTFLLIGDCRPLCFCCVRFSFFHIKQEIGMGKRFRDDLFCVEWDIKPQVNQQSISEGQALGLLLC